MIYGATVSKARLALIGAERALADDNLDEAQAVLRSVLQLPDNNPFGTRATRELEREDRDELVNRFEEERGELADLLDEESADADEIQKCVDILREILDEIEEVVGEPSEFDAVY